MTLHTLKSRSLLSFAWPLCAFLVSSCTSDAARVVMAVTSPKPDQVLNMADDDLDKDLPGLQFDIEATSRGVAKDTTVELFVSGDKQAVSSKVDADGNILLQAVTLPAGTHTIYLQTATASVSSDQDQEYTLRGLVISSPDNGQMLRASDDEDEDTAGIQISVTVEAFALDKSADITLLLDGEEAGNAEADDEGKVQFEGVTLTEGSHTLQATTGKGDSLIASGEVTVSVSNECAAITFVEPAPPQGDATSIVLGGDDCPSGEAFTTRVEIATDVGTGRTVNLFVNDRQVASTTVRGASAVFEDVVFDRRSEPNELRVQVENAERSLCEKAFPGEIIVDCAGPSCSITSPTPVVFVDGNGDQTLYLNASMRDQNGYDIEVTSSTDDAGEVVELIVDGNTRTPLTAIIAADGSTSFNNVDLDEGEHTVEAKCTDSAGNSTFSTSFEWVADVTACDVTITSPADDAVFVPADDEVTTTAGTQVVVSSGVVGDDCAMQRASVCDPAAGIEAPAFAPYAGSSPLLSTITLDTADPMQSLCVEIEDRAGNVGSDDASVIFHAAAPMLLIEDPDMGDQYNAAGGGAYTADASNTSSACDAEFSVACTEIGEPVQLRHNSATGTVFGTATCVGRVGGDPALPAGYAGRVKLTVPFEDGDSTAVIVATQTLTGSSTETLVGTSAAITITGDCRPPFLVLLGTPCGPSNQIGVSQAAALDVSVTNTFADTATASLAFSRQGGGGGTAAPNSPTANPLVFDNVNLGGVGTVTITVTAADAFANSDEVACTTTIVDDLPQITAFTAPAQGAAFGVGQGCNTGTPGEFGVQVQATVDTNVNRTASVLVNAVTVASNVTIGGGGAIDVCVPVPDNRVHMGGSSVTLRVEAVVGAGFAEQSRTVHVVTMPPTVGIVIDPVAPDPSGYRNGVLASWPAPSPQYPGQFSSYEMRCDASALLASATAPDKETWWGDAEVTALPSGLTPDDVNPSAVLALRPEDPRHCVVRALNSSQMPQLEQTPIVQSTDLTLRLRQVVLSAGATAVNLGYAVAAGGDIDGDGIADVLVGGQARAELVFGAADPTAAQKIAFTGGAGSGLGSSVAGLGDFNGDGRDDFAISDPYFNNYSGRVSVFFGRPRGEWPATVNVASGCNADLCLDGTDTNALDGLVIASAGDFDGDGRVDLVAGTPYFPNFTSDGRVIVVLGGAYHTRPCTACRSGEVCGGTSTCERAPGETFWRLQFELPSGDALDPLTAPAIHGFVVGAAAGSAASFGLSVVGLDNFDGATGDDIAIGASGARRVDYLSGRAWIGPGITALAPSDLGLRVGGVPNGAPIGTGTGDFYGGVVANLGDFYTASGSLGAAVDLGVARINRDEMYVEPGDRTTAMDAGFSAPAVTIQASGNVGQSIASAVHPTLGLIGDLDGDGRPELCTGTRTAVPHDVLLWYRDRFAAAVSGNIVTRATGASITLDAETAQTAELAVQYVGDVNDDGELDLAVGDFRANAGFGQVVLLY